MTSAEIKQLCATLYSQVDGIFPGLKHLPKAFEDLERREKALEVREAAVAEKERQ